MGTIEDRYSMELPEADDILRRDGKDTQKNYTKKILMTQITTVFLPGESHGQRSLAGYSPWGHKTR